MNNNWSGFNGRIKVGHHATDICVLLFHFIFLPEAYSQTSNVAADDLLAFVQLIGLISSLILFQ